VPWLELVVLRGPARAFLVRLPFLASVSLRSALYFVLVVAINAVCVPLVNGPSAPGQVEPRDIVFALFATLVANLLIGVDNLLGPGVLFAFVAGRYHRPRLEERALLFVDLRASTAIAERLGGPRFLDFLNAVFADLSAAIADNGGEIHKYVGDEVIATWRLAAGRNEAGVVRAWAAARGRVAANAEAYNRQFGLVPDFRAGMHCGEIVIGELGSRKKEIALIGDPMNTAARILDAARALDRAALASSALLERLKGLPAWVAPSAIAPLALRGKAEPLVVFARESDQPRTLPEC
jgi:adenylate cyclase